MPYSLFSPRVGVVSAYYGLVDLQEGANDFRFTVEGKDAGSTNYHFAIDRILLRPKADLGLEAGARESRRRALERAVSWMLANPADEFDGGRNSVCAEIITLHSLWSNPQLKRYRARYLAEIRERLARLDAEPAYRTQPDEYEMLAVVAYIARQHELDFRTFEVVADRVRQHAEAARSVGSSAQSMFLCAYLNRLGLGAGLPCNVGQSILHTEYTQRGLREALAGDFDRTRADDIFVALSAIAADVCALTDFGNEPTPQIEMLGDRQFWAGLCQDGLNWGSRTGNILSVARLILLGDCLEVAPWVPTHQGHVEYLIVIQEPDGSFGVSSPRSANPFRDGVLAGIMAIASSLEGAD
jgi:hypothetical protein